MDFKFIGEVFQKYDASGSKSTILKPLTWTFGLSTTGLLFSAYYTLSNLIIIFFGVLCGVSFISIIITFFYCLKKSPDLLRSEKFFIQKLAIEKGIFGDNIKGILTQETNPSLKSKDNMDSMGGETK